MSDRLKLSRISRTAVRCWGALEKLGDGPSAESSAPDARRRANRKVAVVTITTALSLTFLNFGGIDPSWLITLLDRIGLDGWAQWLADTLLRSPLRQRNRLIFWAVGQIAAYTILPTLVIRLVLRERLRDYGLRMKGIGSMGRPYLWLFAASVPFVVLASTTPAFHAKYPFYTLVPGEGIWPHMVVWWAVYALQFAALEMFFRGFMLHGLEQRLGYLSIFVMIIPYNMLHFGKPVTEALAAIVGGAVLGYLSLRTRTVWWGALLHIGIAMTMDISVLVQKGLLL